MWMFTAARKHGGRQGHSLFGSMHLLHPLKDSGNCTLLAFNAACCSVFALSCCLLAVSTHFLVACCCLAHTGVLSHFTCLLQAALLPVLMSARATGSRRTTRPSHQALTGKA
jgi:hypothetical protein